MRSTRFAGSGPIVLNSESFFSTADAKQDELQYQRPCILIPALWAEKCRSVIDLSQNSHRALIALNPADQACIVIE
jgi:hypothetical protein